MQEEHTVQGQNVDGQQDGKEPYVTPRLSIYGTVERITQKFGLKGGDDCGGAGTALG